MAGCGKLIQGLTGFVCSQAPSTGAEGDVILINLSDIDKDNSVVVVDSVTQKVTIQSIVLKAGTKGYMYITEGRTLNEAGATMVRGTYRNSWTHTVPFRVMVKNEDAKAFINSMVAGVRIVAILKNKESGIDGDVKYEAYGWTNGLEATEGTTTIQFTDGVVYNITMASVDTATEPLLPLSVFDTDIATTKTMLDALTV